MEVTETGPIRAIAQAIADDSTATGILADGLPAPSGVPRVYGPYVVDFDDVPNDGDSVELFTPTIGDVCLHAYPIARVGAHFTMWSIGDLIVGQNPSGTVDHDGDVWCAVAPIGGYLSDSHGDSGSDHNPDVGSVNATVSAIPILTADPVIAKFFNQVPDPAFTVNAFGASDGTFKLSINGTLTATIAFDASGADIQTAIQLIEAEGMVSGDDLINTGITITGVDAVLVGLDSLVGGSLSITQSGGSPLAGHAEFYFVMATPVAP